MRRTLAYLCLISALALLIVSGMRPAWDRYKAWRARSLLEESEGYAKEASNEVALQKAKAAYLLDPDSTEAARHLAGLASAENRHDALEIWNRLLLSDEGTPADFADAVGLALRLRAHSIARQWIDLWTLRFPGQTAERMRAEIRLLAAMARVAECTQKLAELEAADPGAISPDLLLLQARLLLAKGNGNDAGAAADLLLRAGAAQGSEGLEALLTCAGMETMPEKARLQAVSLVLERPQAKPSERLLCRLLRAHLSGVADPSAGDDLAATLEEAPGATRNRALAVALAIRDGQFVLEHLTFDRATGDREILPLYLEACLRAGRADEVLHVTASESPSEFSPAIGLLFRARAFAALGGLDKAKANLRQAVDVATDDDLVAVESALRSSEDRTLLLQYYERLTGHPKLGPVARAGALVTAYELKDDAAIARHLEGVQLAALRTAPELLERCVYLMLLENVQVNEAVRAAEDLFSRGGGSSGTRLLLAFANARRGRVAIARDLVKAIEPGGIRNTPERVMLTAVLGTPPDPELLRPGALIAPEQALVTNPASS